MRVAVVVVVYNRLGNLHKWLKAWKLCDRENADLTVIKAFNTGENCIAYKDACEKAGVNYIERKNQGFDIGCLQDIAKERLLGFNYNYDYLLWSTDDCIPMRKGFIKEFVERFKFGDIGCTCLELSNQVKPHIRTTGFCLPKYVVKNLTFLKDTILSKIDCYNFEHRSNLTLLNQVQNLGMKVEVLGVLKTACMWDSGNRGHLNRFAEFEKEFEEKTKNNMNRKICIVTTFDKHYKEAGKTLFNSIRRHTDCSGIDFKVITSDIDVVKELGEENCHFITEEIKSRYSGVKYSNELPVEKYASSWYRYEMFNMVGYDRVLCIDSDCICVKDISYLFSEELDQYDLISVEDHIVSKCFIKLVPELERQGLRLANLTKRMREGKIDIQPALLVANKSIVNEGWYKKLLNYANTAPFSYSIDEGILNDFIYMENLKIKLLPLEWDYQDIYELVCPELPVPSDPSIVHCQESKPFKKQRATLDKRMHKWYDMWLKESEPIKRKTIVTIIVWNRFENLKLWVNCWNQCNKMDAEMVVIHNLESDNDKYSQLCKDNGITYVARENKGFDLGAFQDVCKERLTGFPNSWENLIWITDDCIPMSKDFVGDYLENLLNDNIPCYEISDEVKRHIRTTGFLVTKDISKKLLFPKDPMENREDCYQFEHKGINMYEQITKMGKTPMMISKDLKLSPLWDAGVRGHLNLMKKHERIFTPVESNTPNMVINSILDDLAIVHKSDKSSRFHNYAVKYDKILSPFREGFSSILEIGVAQGQSIRMWTDYFTKATIHGADISKASESCVGYSDRIKFHLLDQRDRAQLKNLEQFGPFDLIIDDGNHFWMEQILTFDTLFSYLKKGGIYIVEDTSTSYWKEYKNHPISPIEYFKTLVDAVNDRGARGSVPVNPPEEFGDWDKGWHCREDCHKNLPLFESIQFMQGFIVIYKR